MTKKIKYPNPKGAGKGVLYSQFISDLLDGKIKSNKLEEKSKQDGSVDLEYDDPTQN